MKPVYFLTCLIVSVKSDCRATAEMEGQWVSADSERNSLENGNWRQLAKRSMLLSQYQRPHWTQKAYTCPVSRARFFFFFPVQQSDRLGQAEGKSRLDSCKV